MRSLWLLGMLPAVVPIASTDRIHRQPTQRAFQGGKRPRRCGPRSRRHK